MNHAMAEDDRDPSATTARSALDAAEERTRALAEHAAALLFEIDEQGRTRHVGAGCVEILGYTPEELMRSPLLDLVHPDDRDRVVSDYCRVEQLGTVLTEHRGRHKDGSWRWLEDTVRAYRTASGERRFAVIGRDVTAVKTLNAALERQAVVQHEIAELSRHFLALEPGGIDAEVRVHLELAARLAGAGRTHLVLLDPSAAAIRCSYSWSARGTTQEELSFDPKALECFPWAVRTLVRGETINVATPDALPPEAASEAEDMRRRGVHGELAIPIRIACFSIF